MFYFSDHSSICHVNNLQYFDIRQDYSVWANSSDSNQSSEYVTEAKFVGPKISWRLSIYYIWVPPQRTWERFQRCITQFCTESQHSGKNLQIDNKSPVHVKTWHLEKSWDLVIFALIFSEFGYVPDFFYVPNFFLEHSQILKKSR